MQCKINRPVHSEDYAIRLLAKGKKSGPKTEEGLRNLGSRTEGEKKGIPPAVEPFTRVTEKRSGRNEIGAGVVVFSFEKEKEKLKEAIR